MNTMLDVAIAIDSDPKACSYDVKWSESKPRYFTGPAGRPSSSKGARPGPKALYSSGWAGPSPAQFHKLGSLIIKLLIRSNNGLVIWSNKKMPIFDLFLLGLQTNRRTSASTPATKS